jgi:hypothetical protein
MSELEFSPSSWPAAVRHPAVAAVARRLSEAVPGAVGQQQPVPAGRRERLQDLADADIDWWRRRWWSATRSTASWCWTSCASCRLEPAAVLLEPVGRNTAPAVTLAALQALEGGATRCWWSHRPTRP